MRIYTNTPSPLFIPFSTLASSMDPKSIARSGAGAGAAAAARRPVSARAVKTLKSALSKTWMLTAMFSLFTMSLVMLQEGPGAPTDAEMAGARAACGRLAVTALAQWHASSLAARLPAPAFAVYVAAASAFTAYSGWPVLLLLLAGRGQVHGEAAVYYWLFLALMSAAVPLVIASAFAGLE